MNATTLDARPRRIFGKKCRYLRRAGFTPANLYGAAMESIPVQVDTRVVAHLLAGLPKNTALELKILGESDAHTAFVWGIQRDPLTDEILHVDFYHVEATRRMRATVPLVLAGVDPNLEKLDKRINQMIESIEVECLPLDLPTELQVDASKLKELEDEVRVRDVLISDKIQVLTSLDLVIAKVAGIIEAVEEEAAPVEEAAGAPAEVPTVAKKEREEGEEAEKK